jgi:hypothetical protein
MQSLKKDRVRNNTSESSNLNISKKMESSIREYADKDSQTITARIDFLHSEWDIERWLETNASIIALIGVLLGFFVNIYWLILPMIVLIFLFQHAVQGWCPPIPLFRKLGVRTQKEIDEEIYALKFLRGDFNGNLDMPSKVDQALTSVRK